MSRQHVLEDLLRKSVVGVEFDPGALSKILNAPGPAPSNPATRADRQRAPGLIEGFGSK